MTAPSDQIDATFRGRLGDFDLDVAFSLPTKGISALFGASGCGKTTILRCIAGLNRLDGHFRIGGDVWQNDPTGEFLAPHRRPVGYVFQEPSLFPHLSVRGNLMFGAGRAEKSGARKVVDFDDVVRLLGCGHLLDRAVGMLSGGERQRVAIGRALLAQPRLLLMDEPLSALDRRSRDEILSYLEDMQDALAVPVLYVSHDIAEVARLASRIVVLADGRKISEGALPEVLERIDLHPHTGRFEAGVVLTARVAAHDEAYHLTRLDHFGQTMTIPRVDAEPGVEIRLRVRARDVALSLELPSRSSFRNVLSGTVADVNAEAGTAYAETLIDIGGAKLRARVTREAVDDLGLRVGTPVYALIKSITFDRHSVY